jgi:hypothetical protein
LNRKNGTPLPIKFKYSYESKCADAINFSNQLNQLHHELLHVDGLKILILQDMLTSIDSKFVISIALEFELSYFKNFTKIVQQFDAFSNFLDSISVS